MNTQAGYGNSATYGISGTSNLFTIDGMNENDPFLNLNNSGATNLILGANDVREEWRPSASQQCRLPRRGRCDSRRIVPRPLNSIIFADNLGVLVSPALKTLESCICPRLLAGGSSRRCRARALPVSRLSFRVFRLQPLQATFQRSRIQCGLRP